jgi:hypothetical protein
MTCLVLTIYLKHMCCNVQDQLQSEHNTSHTLANADWEQQLWTACAYKRMLLEDRDGYA